MLGLSWMHVIASNEYQQHVGATHLVLKAGDHAIGLVYARFC